MAKKLPTPEEYGRKLAERKKKADRIPEILKKLDSIAVELAEQAGTLASLPLNDLRNALETLNEHLVDPAQLQEMTGVLKAIQELQEGIIAGMDSLSEGLKTLKFPAPVEPRDYRPEFERLIQEINGFQPTVTPQSVATPAPVAYEFDKVVRDVDGNIAAGTRVVPVMTRH